MPTLKSVSEKVSKMKPVSLVLFLALILLGALKFGVLNPPSSSSTLIVQTGSTNSKLSPDVLRLFLLPAYAVLHSSILLLDINI